VVGSRQTSQALVVKMLEGRTDEEEQPNWHALLMHDGGCIRQYGGGSMMPIRENDGSESMCVVG
jgi:hypothetical protein